MQDFLRVRARSILPLLATAVLVAIGFHLGLVSPADASLVGLLGITMSSAGARVIDPVLTTVAQGYQNPEFVGGRLFPVVPVGQRGGKIITFGKEDFALYATGRAPGTNTKRVQYGYSGSSYALEQHALEGMVPYEFMDEAATTMPGIDLGSAAIRKVQNIIALRLEIAQAALATTAANYAAANKVTLSGTSQWSDYTTGVSDPAAVVETGKEAIRAATGKRPNVAVVGPLVWSKLRNHPKLTDRIKYTGRDGLTTQMVAELFGVQELWVGDAIYDASGTFADVWGKFVVLAHTALAGVAEMGTPSFGYTYRLNGYPAVEQPYNDRNAKSWIYPVTDEVAPVIAGASAGYLISAAVA